MSDAEDAWLAGGDRVSLVPVRHDPTPGDAVGNLIQLMNGEGYEYPEDLQVWAAREIRDYCE